MWFWEHCNNLCEFTNYINYSYVSFGIILKIPCIPPLTLQVIVNINLILICTVNNQYIVSVRIMCTFILEFAANDKSHFSLPLNCYTNELMLECLGGLQNM